MARFQPQFRGLHAVLLCGTFFGFAHALQPGSGFDRGTCLNRTLQWLAAGNSANPQWFHRDPLTGALQDRQDNIELSLLGCQQFCGGWTWYWDAGPRMTTWIIPVLLLLSNIELSPIDKRRFMTINHALGDPIDSLWSLIHKIYTWHRLYDIALSKSPVDRATGVRDEHRARIIATVLAGFEELCGAGITGEEYYHMICRQLGRIGETNEDSAKFREWHRTARELADSRTNEFLRTVLAIFVYVFGLVSAFSSDLGGGNTTPPGGRIGSAIFLSWLVPMALLSNTIGTFSSRRTCLDIMNHFILAVKLGSVQDGNNGSGHAAIANTAANDTAHALSNGKSNTKITVAADTNAAGTAGGTEAVGAARRTHSGNDIPLNTFSLHRNGSTTFAAVSWEDYFNSVQWRGSIYTYRPWKAVYLDQTARTHPRLKNCLMFLGAFLPIFVSALGASVILWYAIPNGFSCRHVWVMCIFGCWIFSVAFTWILYFFVQGKYHWRAVLIKDAIIGIPSVMMVFLSTAGLFNNCFCWSVAMTIGAEAFVPLNTDEAYTENGTNIYRFVVIACLLFQLSFFVAILVWWYKGIKLVRWSEKQRRKEWIYSTGEKLKRTRENLLLFWFVMDDAGP